MTTVANTESFEEKMKNRIKDSIGDLITDEQLTSLINKAMNETFLKPTYREEGMGYNSRKVEVPPFLHTVVKELLTEQVKSAVAVYIDENKESIEKSVTDLIKNGLGKAVLDAIANQFQQPLMNLEIQLRNAMVIR